jgi:hypothetical protein
MSIKPSQKPGIDVNTNAVTILIESIREYCLMAESTPMGIPNIIASEILKRASLNVIGSRLTISWEMG